MPNVYHVKGPKQNLLSIGQLMQKGCRLYIEDDHCAIKDILPRKWLITKISMTSNHLFPLRIVPDMEGKTNTRVAFKAERKEAVVHYDKKENDSAEIQAVFQIEV